MRGVLWPLAAALGLAGAPVHAQASDTLAARPAVLADTAQTPSPGHALRRALLVPGWGQVTNGQTAKAPFAAGAVVGTLVYAAVRQRQYGRYRQAALFAGCRETPDREACADVSGAEDAWLGLGSPTFAAVSPVRDRIRGQRDVAVLLVGVAYALQALDAYVAAELLDFDVSEDLSLRVGAAPAGPTLAARVRL